MSVDFYTRLHGVTVQRIVPTMETSRPIKFWTYPLCVGFEVLTAVQFNSIQFYSCSIISTTGKVTSQIKSCTSHRAVIIKYKQLSRKLVLWRYEECYLLGYNTVFGLLRRYSLPKRWLTFNELHGVASHCSPWFPTRRQSLHKTISCKM
jgi:hypothetical protein